MAAMAKAGAMGESAYQALGGEAAEAVNADLKLDDEWRKANPLDEEEFERLKKKFALSSDITLVLKGEVLTAKVLAAFEQTGGGVSSEEQEGRWRRYFRSDQDKVMKKVDGLETKIEGLEAMLMKLLEAQNLKA